MLIATLIASLGTWAALYERIAADPVNHVGFEPLLALVPLLLPIVVVLQPRYRVRRGVRAVVIAHVVLSVLGIVAMDRANVLLEKDRWLRRGMPERPCGPIARSFWACCSVERERVWCSNPR